MNRLKGNTDAVVARNYTSHIPEYKSISNTQTSDDQSTKREPVYSQIYLESIHGDMDHDRDRDRGEPLMRADLPRVHSPLFASVIVGHEARPIGNKSIQEPISLRSADVESLPNTILSEFYKRLWPLFLFAYFVISFPSHSLHVLFSSFRTSD